jgi:protoheme IX farnesyltransferase
VSTRPVASAVLPGTLQRLADFATLTRPRLNSLTVFAVGAGWWSAAAPGADPRHLVATMVGAALSGGGASALNQVLERRLDARMERTRDRPLPAGRLAPAEAVAFGAALSGAGLLILLLGANALTACLALLCLVTYVSIYTPLKTRTSLNTLVGTVPGALPPVMGVAAATGELGPSAWFLFALLAVWQLPHFLSIAWLWREDYARGGFAMLPVVTRGDATTGRQVVVQTLLVVAVSLFALPMGLAGRAYFVVALLCGAGFLWAAVRFGLRRSDATARVLMRASILYLPLVLAAFALDRLAA